MFAVALAALPFKIPIAHLGGGDLTEGAIDDSLRHCITRLSHLHFTATEEYARRVIQLGEGPSRVFVTEEPALDNARNSANVSPTVLEEQFGVDVKRPFLVVTFHPVTLEYEQTEWQVDELLAALQAAQLSIVFTMPNADTASRINMHNAHDLNEAQAQGALHACQAAQAAVANMAQRAAAVTEINNAATVQQQRANNPSAPANSSATWQNYLP